jgi:spermidine synthase
MSIRNIDYIISYLYPVTIEVANSLWNPVLEVVLSAGRYSLNSQNTNYSHGSLLYMFKTIFRKLDLNWENINDVLILGFGTGSIAEIIGKYKQDCMIDGVEIDNKVIELGEKYFNTRLLKNVDIHCTSADQFIENCQKKYDLIIIDVYIDINVPEEVETEQFLVRIKNTLKPGGLVVFNKSIHTKTIQARIPLLRVLYERTFGNLQIMTINIIGKIFISKN